MCIEYFGRIEAFLSRCPCVDCGLKRKAHQVAGYWSLTRCLPCRQKHRHSDLEGPLWEMWRRADQGLKRQTARHGKMHGIWISSIVTTAVGSLKVGIIRMRMAPRARMISKVDKLAWCLYCHDWMKEKKEERLWPWWYGHKAFGAYYYSAIFQQS